MKWDLKLEDRILAKIRTPEYRKAYARFRRTWKPNPGTFVVSCNDAVWMRSEKSNGKAVVGPLPEQVQKFCNRFVMPYPYPPETSAIGLSPIILAPRYENGKHVVGPDGDLFLSVKIDMTRSCDSIVKEVKRLYRKFGVKTSKTKHKNSLQAGILMKKGLSIWDIHNMVEKENGNLYQVARTIGMAGKPTDDEKDGKIYKAVRDAYHKADRMISIVHEDF